VHQEDAEPALAARIHPLAQVRDLDPAVERLPLVGDADLDGAAPAPHLDAERPGAVRIGVLDDVRARLVDGEPDVGERAPGVAEILAGARDEVAHFGEAAIVGGDLEPLCRRSGRFAHGGLLECVIGRRYCCSARRRARASSMFW
jgi:hypothetical protein